MARVFLSYARDDVEIAKQLAGLIGEAGHQVWWDREISGGTHFSSEIDKALQEAHAVLVLWTEASIKSAWVQDEAAEGRDSGRLVPAVLNGARPPLGFRQYQSIELGQWAGEGQPHHFDALLKAIEKTGEGKAEAHERKEKPAQKPSLSVCVLPFENMSGEPEQEYFSDGISEDIITDLSNVSALSVVARNTSYTFKGQSHDVKEIAQKLGVTHVLEGSVRKAGNRVRITAQLIDGAKGDHVWAARYDRDLTDIFEIQDEISKEIVRALRLRLMPAEELAIEKRGTENAEAYNLYLMARQQWIWGSWGNSRRDQAIVRICSQATTFDPGYAEAWALMALAQAELRFWHGKDDDPLPAAARALEINPGLAEPHCVKLRHFEQEGRTDEADKELKQALKLSPNSWEVNREAARLMFSRDRMADAIRYFEKAAQLMDTDFHSCLMLQTCYLGENEEAAAVHAARRALDRAEVALSKDPTNGAALAAGASSLIMLNEVDRAKDWLQRALLLDPENLMVRYNVACSLTFRNSDLEGALDLLGPYFESIESPGNVHHAEIDPDMDPLRDNPRFVAMIENAKTRLGMAQDAAAAE